MRKLLPILLCLLVFRTAAQAQSTITLGTGTSSASTNALFSTSTTTNKYARTIAIYSAAEITAAGGLPGLITKLAWDKSGTGEYTTADMQISIFLKHVPFTLHPTDPVTWATEVVGATQVYNSTTASFPTGTGWKDFVFTTPFLWNGTDNLEVFVDFYRPGTPTGSINWGYTAVTKGATATQVNSVAIPTVRTATNRPNMQLTFAPATPNDVGIIAVTAPTSACGLSNQETVTVTIRNFGSASQSNIPVTYSVNGTPIPAPETFAGPLASGATANYSFTTKANLAAAGTFTIAAATNLTGDANAANNSTTTTVTNSLVAGLPQLNFETPATGIGALRVVTKTKSTVVESTAASLGTGSTKGLIMAGVTDPAWVMPVSTSDPAIWVTNPEHLAGAYICFSPAGGNPTDPLWLSFDLKQTYKTANANTNFRVTVNGTMIGSTYKPHFSGTPINWRKVYVDLTPYKNLASIEIGLESLVMEEYANGAGTANLIDNVRVVRLDPTGVKENALSRSLNVYPNPSAGTFSVSLPQGKAFELEVTDLTGKVILEQSVKTNTTQVNLQAPAKGIYLLKVTSEGKTAIQKLAIQ